jgi:hypothetical protein
VSHSGIEGLGALGTVNEMLMQVRVPHQRPLTLCHNIIYIYIYMYISISTHIRATRATFGYSQVYRWEAAISLPHSVLSMPHLCRPGWMSLALCMIWSLPANRDHPSSSTSPGRCKRP